MFVVDAMITAAAIADAIADAHGCQILHRKWPREVTADNTLTVDVCGDHSQRHRCL